MFSIANTTALFALGTKITLRELPDLVPGITFNPRKHNAAVYRSTRYTAQIFGSGKVVVVGCKSEAEVREAQDDLVEKLRNIGVCVSRGEINISNYVIPINKGHPISLTNLAQLGSYQPEIFNALFLKLATCTAVVFRSGKGHLTGVKRLEDVPEAIMELNGILSYENSFSS